VIDWRKVSTRTLAVWTLVTFAGFATSCYLVAVWSDEVSSSALATHAVLGIAGINMFAFPVFFVKLIGRLIHLAVKRGL
jgi:hypothetical protein